MRAKGLAWGHQYVQLEVLPQRIARLTRQTIGASVYIWGTGGKGDSIGERDRNLKEFLGSNRIFSHNTFFYLHRHFLN